MREELEKTLGRFEELERQMADPQVLADSGRMAGIFREHGSLAKMATKYRDYKCLNAQLAELRQMAESDDPEERELAEAEIEELKPRRERLWEELLEMTIGGEDANRARCIMEIRAGTGGEEAALFARDLFEMYRHYAEVKGWKCEIMDASASEQGGFKEIMLAFEGEGCYRELRFESGGHRVQRVPETEAKGRIHTSLATVAVLTEPEEVEIDIDPEEVREETMRASGPGGQHVNKTSSAIRLTHFPTGITVSMQEEKSQHKNRTKAWRILRSRLYEKKKQEEDARRASQRKSLIGSGDRSERVRTYNFPDNRVTHHPIGLSVYHLDQILGGDLGQVLDPILEYEKQLLRDSMKEPAKKNEDGNGKGK
ncbi:MAG: peptide chain release factor 1 [Planctomycetes bacterium]|nr:peptide chain release factor 1 [Planctomycetota bacterium]